MLRSISADALLCLGVACAALAAPLPCWSAEYGANALRGAVHDAPADEFEDATATDGDDASEPESLPAPTRNTAGRRLSVHPPTPLELRGAAHRLEPAGRSRVSRRDPVRRTNYQEGVQLEPIAERPPFVRPFRKIAEILPYDSYEPDKEIAEKDRCFNLCPRPSGGDCPDCAETDAEGRVKEGVSCPECPPEQDLQRIGRAAGEPDIQFLPRNFAHIHYCWEPTNMYHHPIYFEDVPLERYGHTRHYLIQPLWSNAKFALQLVGLPYQMTIYPVCSRQYSLGYYRPGEQAPYLCYQLPLNARAALVEAGVISGAYFLFAPGVGP
jgi:hypothetical protein